MKLKILTYEELEKLGKNYLAEKMTRGAFDKVMGLSMFIQDFSYTFRELYEDDYILIVTKAIYWFCATDLEGPDHFKALESLLTSKKIDINGIFKVLNVGEWEQEDINSLNNIYCFAVEIGQNLMLIFDY